MTSIDAEAARSLDGVFTILTHQNAPRVTTDDEALRVLQSDQVAYHGQVVAAVVAASPEIATEASARIVVRYDEQPHDVVLSADHPALYKPPRGQPELRNGHQRGRRRSALAEAAVAVDHTYATPPYHNNPLETHAASAAWSDDGVTLYDTNQGPRHSRRRRQGVRLAA